MPICPPSRLFIFAALLAASTVSAQAETEYFEGTYACKDYETRSFWALNFEDNEAQFGLRRLNDRRKSGFERGSLALDGRNIEIKGTDNDNFHAQGTLSADGTSLDLAWYNRNGKVLKRCQPFTLTKTDASPVEQWDAVIALLETPAPTADVIENVLTLSRKLPSHDFLPKPDQRSYRKKRSDAFLQFSKRYQEHIPQILAEAKVATPEDRTKLRRDMASMAKVGYRGDLTSHYAQRLYRNDFDVVPAFFGDDAGHCETLKGKQKLSSTADIEAFVGLPRYWWTREQATAIIERAENCAANDGATDKTAKQMIAAISREFPKLEGSVKAKKFLEDEVSKHAALEPGLASLAETAQYTIPKKKRTQLGVSETYYQLFYLDDIAEAKAASIETGKAEVDKMFEGDAPIKPTTDSNAKAPLRCSKAFGIKFDDIQSPYAQLNNHCRETAKAILQEHLETLTVALNSSDLTIEDLASDSELDFNRDLQRAASQLDLRDQARRYVRDLNAKRTKLVNSRMNKVIESTINTKSGDTAVLDALCKDVKHFKDLEQVCRQFRKTLAE